MLRARLGGMAMAGLAALLLLAGCGAAPGGGGGGGSGGGGTGQASGSSAAASGGSAGGIAGAPTSTSLKGWKAVAGSGGTGPTIDPSTGDPKGPSLELPGDKSYVWADLKKPISEFSFDANTQGLFDLFFGNNDNGQGYMFRIDTRGGTNYSGFGETEDWTDWDCPGAGDNSDPANTWIHVDIKISGSNVNATWTPAGGSKNTLAFQGYTDSCLSMADGTTLDATLGSYKPAGTAFGFQGDGLGATSMSWIANFTVK